MKLKKFHLPIDPLRPHKRPVSVASPSIILDEAGNVKMIFGAAGGKQIATALSQVNKYRILHGGACGGAVGARVRALAGDIALCSWARHLTLTVPLSRLHPGVQMGTSEFNSGGNSAMDWHPIQGAVEIFLVASYYRKRDKLRPDWPLGSYADFNFKDGAKI